MAPAAAKLEQALQDVAARDLRAPVVSNVEAVPYRERIRVKELLVKQVTMPVRWEESVQRLAADGVTEALELGSGAVLAGLVKRTAPGVKVTTIGEPHEVKAWGSETKH
jgi:[acyl-carrier-protein] S-malonyltransferase